MTKFNFTPHDKMDPEILLADNSTKCYRPNIKDCLLHLEPRIITPVSNGTELYQWLYGVIMDFMKFPDVKDYIFKHLAC